MAEGRRFGGPRVLDGAETPRLESAQTTATNATASAAARKSTPQIKYSSKMGCKSAAGWGAASSCTRFAALAVNNSPSREKTTAMIRETGIASSLLRSKASLVAAAMISAAAATPTMASIVRPVPKIARSLKRAHASGPSACHTGVPTAERSSAAPANHPLRTVATASKESVRALVMQALLRAAARHVSDFACRTTAQSRFRWRESRPSFAIGNEAPERRRAQSGPSGSEFSRLQLLRSLRCSFGLSWKVASFGWMP